VIAFLGGSTTACVAVAPELRFPALTGTMLSERGFDAEILNASRSGGTLHDTLNTLPNQLVLDHVDVAVVMHATNDMAMLARPEGYRPRMGRTVSVATLGTWAGQMLSSRSDIFGAIRMLATNMERVRGTRSKRTFGVSERNDPSLPPIPAGEFRARLLTFVDMARNFGIEPVLMTESLTTIRNELTPDWADLGNPSLHETTSTSRGARPASSSLPRPSPRAALRIASP